MNQSKQSLDYPQNALYFFYNNKELNGQRLDFNNITKDNIEGFIYVVQKLKPQFQRIVNMRFQDHMTLDAIGKVEDNVTRERIRQKLQAVSQNLQRSPYIDIVFNGLSAWKKQNQVDKDVSIIRLFLNTDISALDLSCRTFNALSNAGYITLEKIITADENDLRGLWGIGNSAYDEIQNKIKNFATAFVDNINFSHSNKTFVINEKILFEKSIKWCQDKSVAEKNTIIKYITEILE